jgi:hypothetical protein
MRHAPRLRHTGTIPPQDRPGRSPDRPDADRSGCIGRSEVVLVASTTLCGPASASREWFQVEVEAFTVIALRAVSPARRSQPENPPLVTRTGARGGKDTGNCHESTQRHRSSNRRDRTHRRDPRNRRDARTPWPGFLRAARVPTGAGGRQIKPIFEDRFG